MTCSTNYTGTLGLFFAEVYINLSSYDIYMPIPLIPASGRAALDDISSAIREMHGYNIPVRVTGKGTDGYGYG